MKWNIHWLSRDITLNTIQSKNYTNFCRKSKTQAIGSHLMLFRSWLPQGFSLFIPNFKGNLRMICNLRFCLGMCSENCTHRWHYLLKYINRLNASLKNFKFLLTFQLFFFKLSHVIFKMLQLSGLNATTLKGHCVI